MHKDLNTKKIGSMFFNPIDKYVSFVNQIVNDEQYLKCVNELLPFDGVVNASLNLGLVTTSISKLGVSIMRMDIEPPLFSLGVTMEVNESNQETSSESTFIAACLTLEELQRYVSTERFKREVTELYDKKLSYH